MKNIIHYDFCRGFFGGQVLYVTERCRVGKPGDKIQWQVRKRQASKQEAEDFMREFYQQQKA